MTQFIGTRVEDRCDGTWNVCGTEVGCLLGDRSYISGRFPNTQKVITQVFEPSTVTVSFFLSEIAGAGTSTVLTFYEGSCDTPTRVEITGKAFTAESEKQGYVSRSADLSSIGDHLVKVESDARTKFLMKLDVLPVRLKASSSSP